MITRITKVSVRYVNPAADEAERRRRAVAELQARSVLLAAGIIGSAEAESVEIGLDCGAAPRPDGGREG